MADLCKIMDRDDVFVIEAPFKEGFILALKRRIPWRDRAWFSKTKLWTVRGRKYESVIRELAITHFKDVVLERREGNELVTIDLHTGHEERQAALW